MWQAGGTRPERPAFAADKSPPGDHTLWSKMAGQGPELRMGVHFKNSLVTGRAKMGFRRLNEKPSRDILEHNLIAHVTVLLNVLLAACAGHQS